MPVKTRNNIIANSNKSKIAKQVVVALEKLKVGENSTKQASKDSEKEIPSTSGHMSPDLEITFEENVPDKSSIDWTNRIKSVISTYIQSDPKEKGKGAKPCVKETPVKRKVMIAENKNLVIKASPEPLKEMSPEIEDYDENISIKSLKTEKLTGGNGIKPSSNDPVDPMNLILEKLAKLERKIKKNKKKIEKKRTKHSSSKKSSKDTDEESTPEEASDNEEITIGYGVQDTDLDDPMGPNPFKKPSYKPPTEEDEDDENPFAPPTNKRILILRNTNTSLVLNALEEWFVWKMHKNLWDYPGLSGYPRFKLEMLSRKAVSHSTLIRLYDDFIFPGELNTFVATDYTKSVKDLKVKEFFTTLALSYSPEYGFDVPRVVGMMIVHCLAKFGELEHLFPKGGFR